MDRLVSKISESEMMQRWRAIEQARAAIAARVMFITRSLRP